MDNQHKGAIIHLLGIILLVLGFIGIVIIPVLGIRLSILLLALPGALFLIRAGIRMKKR